jgi:ferredoxin
MTITVVVLLIFVASSDWWCYQSSRGVLDQGIFKNQDSDDDQSRKHIFVIGGIGITAFLEEIAVLPKTGIDQETRLPAVPGALWRVRHREREPAIPSKLKSKLRGRSCRCHVRSRFLQALMEAGFEIESPCLVGNCGPCMVDYCKGDIKHRGVTLSDEIKAGFILSC